MSSRTLLNLVLLAVVGVLVALVVVEPGKKAPAPEPKVTALARDAVTSIRIEHPAGKGEAVELAKVNGHWRLKSPIDFPAGDFRADTLAAQAEAESHSRFPATADALAKFKLDTPAVTLLLNGERLAYGDTAPINHYRYLLHGDTVHLTDDTAYFQLIRDWQGLVDTKLLPGEAKVTALAIPGHTLRRGDNGWQVEPELAGLSADEPVRLAAAWQEAQAVQVRPYTPPAPDQTPAPAEKVTVEREGEAPVAFLVVKRAPELVLARPELKLQYHLTGNRSDELLDLKAEKKDAAADAEAKPAEPPVTPPPASE